MIAIVDYEAGNLTSVERAVKHLGADCKITQDAGEIAAADQVIFPGVGAAGASMDNLRRLGLDAVLGGAVAAGKPVLGICVGTQIIFERSQEDLATCLGLMQGEVVRFPFGHQDAGGAALKVPHMGWNRVQWTRPHPVTAGIPEEAEFYFVHSFYPVPENPADVIGTCEYGLTFAAAVAKGSLVALQFHAEKSGRPGLRILENFINWDGKEATDA